MKKAKTNSGDEKARELYRKAGDDLLAARRWVRHLERIGKGERVLDEPLSEEEIKKAHEKDKTVEGIVRVDIDDVMVDIDAFNDIISEKLVGNGLLTDIFFQVIDVDEGVLLIRVKGSTEMLVDNDEAASESERCLVAFQPQQWVNDYAIDSGPVEEIDVTRRVREMGREAALAIEDNSDESDSLVSGLHRHTGPFYVSCEAPIREFFGVNESDGS